MYPFYSPISSLFGYFNSHSNLLTVGLGLVCLNYLSSSRLSGWIQQLFWLLQHLLFVRVEILENDNYYHWLVEWLSDNRHLFIVSANYRAKAIKSSGPKSRVYASFSTVYKITNWNMISLRKPPPVGFEPGPGQHLIWYKRCPILFERDSSERSHTSSTFDNSHSSGSSNKLTFWKLGPSKELLQQMFIEARDYCLSKSQGRVLIYTRNDEFSRYGEWQVFLQQEKIPFESVILDHNMADDILKDIERFMSRKDEYKSKGIPYRRSYLFYGPPGSGKTSFVKVLAGKLNLNVCILTLGHNLDDDALNRLFTNAPENAIILIEDIDVIFPSREDLKEHLKKANDTSSLEFSRSQKKVTFSGLLNAIDGVASQEGRIVIMTTNYPEHLDPALLRPGRVDRVYEFSLASKVQAQQMFLKFHPKKYQLAKEFVANFEEKRFSMAQLQSYFILTMDNPQEAANYRKFVEETMQQEIGRQKSTQDNITAKNVTSNVLTNQTNPTFSNIAKIQPISQDPLIKEVPPPPSEQQQQPQQPQP
jgi:chaperone BCS1